MKKHYFDHDYSARNDQKILTLRFEYGWEGYGIFWAILEIMAEDTTGFISRGALGGLSISLGVPCATLEKIIMTCLEIGLFKEDDNKNIFSNRMINHKTMMSDFSKYGRIGVEIREAKRGASRGASSPSSSKESKEDKSIRDQNKEKEKEKEGEPKTFEDWKNEIKKSGKKVTLEECNAILKKYHPGCKINEKGLMVPDYN